MLSDNKAKAVDCPGEFTPVTAAEAFAALNPGWNLGNCLDAIPNEDFLEQPTREDTSDDILKAGFKRVSAFRSSTGCWIDRGLYAILNIHHDSLVPSGRRFAPGSREPLNELAGDTEEAAAELNKLNDIFLERINNPQQRVVALAGLGHASIKTSQWSLTPLLGATESAARWKYYDHFIRTCDKYGFSSVVWDNGLDLFNREEHQFYDPVEADILFNAVEGLPKASPGSAYIFHRVGDPVAAQDVTYLLNGNTLTDIRDSSGTSLDSSQDSVSGGTVAFTAEYLGILHQSVYPISYAGLPKVAAVKALKADGTYLSDDWTQRLGPLQQARWTYGNLESTEEAFRLNNRV
ncbi:hypothetical protein VTO42DRAFT_4887 [Malbranchea cinnamomea]